MLRDDRQTALNDVIALAEQAADHYQDAAERAGGMEPAMLFRDCAARRRAMAERLSEHIKKIDDLPRSPDRDRETIRQAVSRLKGLVSKDERLVLLDEREQGEQELATAIAAALREPLPSDTQELLRRYHQEVMAARDRLAMARREI